VPANITPPIVVELGTTSPEQVDRLGRGGVGRLAEEIAEVLACVRSNAAVAAANRAFVPVVVVYTEAEEDGDA